MPTKKHSDTTNEPTRDDVKPAEVSASGGSDRDSRVKGRRGPRKKPWDETKKQVTVRIHRDLLRAAIDRAKKRNMPMTDAFEQGLWSYLADEPPEVTKQLRFVASLLPLRVQKKLLSYAGYLMMKDQDLSDLERSMGNTIDFLLADPRFLANLEKLGGSSQKQL